MEEQNYYFIFMELQKGIYKVMKDRFNIFNGSNIVSNDDVIEVFNNPDYKGKVKVIDNNSLTKFYGR